MIVLAVSATTKGVGYVVTEDRYVLDWSVMRFSAPKSGERILERLLFLIEHGDVELVLLSERSFHKATKAALFLNELLTHLKGREIAYRLVEKGAQRRHLSRYDRAVGLSASIPELRGYLPKKRKLWESESANLAIFDAAALLEAESLL